MRMVRLILQDLQMNIEAYLPYAVITGIAGLILLQMIGSVFTRLTRNKMKNRTKEKILIFYLLYIYFFMILFIALLSREPGSRTKASFMPFSSLTGEAYGDVFVVENVLMFIPFGIFLPLLNKKFQRAKSCLAAGFLCSFIIEVLQLLSQRGYFQTDDILMNIIGTGIGFVILKILSKIFPKK